MRIVVVISSPTQVYTFAFSSHTSCTLEDQRIEEEFYTQWHGSVHQGVHFEFEICSEMILEHPLTLKTPNPFHVHCSKKDGKQYVCWTGHLPDFDTALNMLLTWCVGTVYTIENEIDYVSMLNIYYIQSGDFEATRAMFKEQFDIQVDHHQSGD